jgi:histidinol-phosphate aminotransferase
MTFSSCSIPTFRRKRAVTKTLNYRPALARMRPYAPGEQPPPGKFIKLNTNENPYPPPPAVLDAIRSAADGPLNRYPDPMADSFRRAAAEALGMPGPDWILAGNGSDEILTILVRAFVSEGQELRLPYPSYILYRTLADIQGALWQQIAFEDDWTLPGEFGSAGDDVRLVFLPNPNSPSGTIVAPGRVAELARSLPCPLVVDEAYADFAECHCLDLVQQDETILVTRTLSKSYALAGIRFGFLVAQPHVIAELVKIKDSYNCDSVSIAAATAAMGCQDWLRETRQKLNATRQRLEQGLTRLGFSVTPSQANFVWCTHPGGKHQLIYEFLKENQILVRYMDFPDWGDGLRISVGTDDQIDACLMILDKALASAG